MAHPAHVLALRQRYPALALIGDTPLVRITAYDDTLPQGVEIWAKAEFMNPGGSIKDRPVLRMLSNALREGDLTDAGGPAVLDSSSGNAGIAYAMIGATLGVPVELVIPANASEERKKRILAHGATIHYTDPIDGYDEALREVRRRYQSDPDRYFFSDQYGNAGNWQAHYDTTGAEILAQTAADGGPPLRAFVGGVGTGGTLTGIGRRIKDADPTIQIACVVPDLFPGIEGLKPLGDPDDIVPEILDEALIDERHDVSIDIAYDVCRRLAHHGLFVGQSSGAYVAAAQRVAQTLTGPARVVTILNDIGERYFSTRLWD